MSVTGLSGASDFPFLRTDSMSQTTSTAAWLSQIPSQIHLTTTLEKELTNPSELSFLSTSPPTITMLQSLIPLSTVSSRHCKPTMSYLDFMLN